MLFSKYLFFKTLVFSFLAYMVASCASPRPILRMKPIQENAQTQQIFWQNGTEYIQNVEDSVGVRMGFGFFDETKQLMHINCEFINFSNKPVLIAPETFFYTTFDTTNHQLVSDQKNYWAINPEKMILDLDKAIARSEASAKNSKGWAIAGLVVAVTATAIIASQTKTNNNNNNNNLRSDQNNPQPKNDLKSGAALAQTAGLLTANVAINNDTKKSWQAEDDKMEKYNWENLTLRKTHLFPQESIKGSVLFPVKNHVFALKYLKFRFPIENTEKIFLFKQKWINSAFE